MEQHVDCWDHYCGILCVQPLGDASAYSHLSHASDEYNDVIMTLSPALPIDFSKCDDFIVLLYIYRVLQDHDSF